MPTTITVSEKTHKRLQAYKRGGSTFDDLLNRLMDEVALEDVMAEDLEEAYRRLHDPKSVWLNGQDVIDQMRGLRKSPPRVVRRGPAIGIRAEGGAKRTKGTRQGTEGSARKASRGLRRTAA